jgi:curved DNA-binding protein CbpA
MKTLYDLLGALPHDSAEDLRTAFRRAVKGTHPDMRPGDPDAAEKFREIVRASEILGDAEQRAVYDDLLTLASLEQTSAHPVAARLHGIASATTALAWASVVTVSGYFLFMYLSGAPFASIIGPETMAAFPPISEHSTTTGEPTAPPAARPGNASATSLASHASAALGLVASEKISASSEGFPACGTSDLKIRFADLDDALQPAVLPAYVDPGVVFYRKSAAAFPDIAGVKRTEKASHSKPAPTISRKRPFVAAAIATSVTPLSLRRMTAQYPSGGEAGASPVRLR